MKTYTFAQFNTEISKIWKDNENNGSVASYRDQDIVEVTRRAAHEIGMAGWDGGHMAQVAEAWKQFKAMFPARVASK